MSQTRYTINHKGREWWVYDPEIVECYKQKGATVKAETGEDLSPPLTEYCGADLLAMKEFAELHGWEQVTEMVEDRIKRIQKEDQ